MNDYEKLKTIIDTIDCLIKKRVASSDYEFMEWKEKAEIFLRNHYDSDIEFNKFTNIKFEPSFIMLDATDEDFVIACRNGLLEAKAQLTSYLDDYNDNKEKIQKEEKQQTNKSKVFIVHGHDNELKEKTARIIEKQGIGVIILSEQVSEGNTIIEKIEKNDDVGAAICLFTGDDKCEIEGKTECRARQNVVFEAGYFIGKLGRQNVIIISNSTVDMPSDLQGVVYANSENWEIDVLRELKNIGYNIDFNKLY